MTAHKSLRYQQNVIAVDIGVILLRAPSTKIHDLIPLAPMIVDAANRIQRGMVLEVS